LKLFHGSSYLLVIPGSGLRESEPFRPPLLFITFADGAGVALIYQFLA
jgi:hypothetical protein